MTPRVSCPSESQPRAVPRGSDPLVIRGVQGDLETIGRGHYQNSCDIRICQFGLPGLKKPNPMLA